MKIKTAYLGEVEIEKADIIGFEYGIPGFEEEKEFVLLPIEGNITFHALQSVHTEALAFIVTNPYTIVENYSFDLEESMVKALQIKEEQEVAVFTIVSLKETIASSTINLKAPIVLNTTNKKAKQVILNNEEYSIRHVISAESLKG
ncbi:flagellar assembly protein FliW [Psychrobacillus sp. BL-248-WT-3]|uniref:flagellar assembly protein FliW n=1 Tax=Psychrobacillus sp. BL-248-WT-3 TaxID=2725306 RepID=UPI00146E797F|nr:flagellar assembly protein FliW [Psychrobacillus sp. BL-248-WT-3]NME05068.1 flagellar assembly protein FliW [Psychrobacillus sp. BL-248-WT-3]